ncbi:MAG: hypothetical protein V9G22_12045 [Ottowia sp.]
MAAGGGAGLLADEGVHLGVGDAQLGLDLALAQARQQHLVAHVVLEVLHRDAVLLDAAVQLGHRGQLVLARDRQLGLGQRGGVDLEAGFARVLQLRALGDQALQDFLAQRLGLRRRGAALAQLALGTRHAGAHFLVGDRLAVDQGDDVVGLARRADGRRPRNGRGAGRGRRGGAGGRGLPAQALPPAWRRGPCAVPAGSFASPWASWPTVRRRPRPGRWPARPAPAAATAPRQTGGGAGSYS